MCILGAYGKHLENGMYLVYVVIEKQSKGMLVDSKYFFDVVEREYRWAILY